MAGLYPSAHARWLASGPASTCWKPRESSRLKRHEKWTLGNARQRTAVSVLNAGSVLNIEQTASNRSVIFVPVFTAQSHDDTGFRDRIPVRRVPVANPTGHGGRHETEHDRSSP